jgi:hypothetical protein
MKVDGKNVDMLQWLKDTGGANAIKRFSTQQVQNQATQQTTPAQKLSTEDAAALKIEMQYAKAGVVPGVTEDTTLSSYLTQLKALQTSTTPAAANTGAAAPKTTGTNGNTTAVTGKNNTVDFSSNSGQVNNNTVTVNGHGNVVRGFNGGQQNNAFTITGSSNRLFAGNDVTNSTVNVQGGGNTVTLASQASNNTVSVTGNNVKLAIGSEGLTAGSNQNWNISVAASNVEVNVVNGQASVSMSDELKNNYKVSIDNTAKTVSITPI